jgi:hypothetical protein
MSQTFSWECPFNLFELHFHCNYFKRFRPSFSWFITFTSRDFFSFRILHYGFIFNLIMLYFINILLILLFHLTFLNLFSTLIIPEPSVIHKGTHLVVVRHILTFAADFILFYSSEDTWPKVTYVIRMCSAFRLGLKRKCLFPFSRKCENHAKMGRFSRNFAKFRFAKIFVFAKIFAKIWRNFRFRENFRENLTKFSQKFSRKRKFSRKW